MWALPTLAWPGKSEKGKIGNGVVGEPMGSGRCVRPHSGLAQRVGNCSRCNAKPGIGMCMNENWKNEEDWKMGKRWEKNSFRFYSLSIFIRISSVFRKILGRNNKPCSPDRGGLFILSNGFELVLRQLFPVERRDLFALQPYV